MCSCACLGKLRLPSGHSVTTAANALVLVLVMIRNRADCKNVGSHRRKGVQTISVAVSRETDGAIPAKQQDDLTLQPASVSLGLSHSLSPACRSSMPSHRIPCRQSVPIVQVAAVHFCRWQARKTTVVSIRHALHQVAASRSSRGSLVVVCTSTVPLHRPFALPACASPLDPPAAAMMSCPSPQPTPSRSLAKPHRPIGGDSCSARLILLEATSRPSA